MGKVQTHVKHFSLTHVITVSCVVGKLLEEKHERRKNGSEEAPLGTLGSSGSYV